MRSTSHPPVEVLQEAGTDEGEGHGREPHLDDVGASREGTLEADGAHKGTGEGFNAYLEGGVDVRKENKT